MNIPQPGSITEKIHANIISAADAFKLFEDIGFLASDSAPICSVLVGFSGGADSTALLCALHKLGEEGFPGVFPKLKLYAVHVNHMIRGSEADRDENFCRIFCEKHGIPLFVYSADVPKLAKESGDGLEEAARKLRYNVFDELCREHSMDFIATAHNAGDNLETMLFNFARGAGASGIAGIPPKRGKIIRPLLFCSKPDIIEYCRENSTGFVVDSTNADTIYTRNYIRNELIPRMKTLNSELEHSANKLSQTLRRDEDFISSAANEYIGENSCEKLTSLHPALLSRVVMKKYRSAAAEISPESEKQLSFEHINQIITIIGQQKNTSLDLPGMITVSVRSGVLRFQPTEREKPKPESYFYELSNGENYIPEAKVRIIISNDEKYINTNKNIYKLFIHKFLNFAKIKGKLYVRCRNSGDRIRFGADENSRSVKKLLSDAASGRFSFKGECGMELKNLYASPDFRSAVPFVCDDGGIVYIPDFPSRDDMLTDKNNDPNSAVHFYFIAE